jgi:hypothetical protein
LCRLGDDREILHARRALRKPFSTHADLFWPGSLRLFFGCGAPSASQPEIWRLFFVLFLRLHFLSKLSKILNSPSFPYAILSLLLLRVLASLAGVSRLRRACVWAMVFVHENASLFFFRFSFEQFHPLTQGHPCVRRRNSRSV